MQIDISKLRNNYVSVLNVDDEVNLPNGILDDIRLNGLSNVRFNGNISIDEDNMLVVSGKLTGTMNLKDDITLDEVFHEFDIEIEEILENNQNILDINEILWQNILVEIPSKIRSTSDDINLEGDGWRVISEDKFNEERNKLDNPFSDLNELLKTKEDR